MLAEARVNNAPVRAGLQVVSGLLAAAVIQSWLAVLWAVVNVAVIAWDRRYAQRLQAAAESGAKSNPDLGDIVWVALQSTSGNALALILWLSDLERGATLGAVYLLGGAANAIFTFRRDTALLTASLGVALACFVGAAIAKATLSPQGFDVGELTPILALPIMAVFAGLIWRMLRDGDLAESRAREAVLAAEAARDNERRAQEIAINAVRAQVHGPLSAARVLCEAWDQDPRFAGAPIAALRACLDLSESALQQGEAQTLIEADLRALVLETAESQRAVARARGVEFFVDVAPDCPAAVMADAHRIQRITFYLLSNALAATAKGGVRIRLHMDGDPVRGEMRFAITVADTGAGFAENRLPALMMGEHAGETDAERLVAACVDLANAGGMRLRARSRDPVGSLFTLLFSASAAAVETSNAHPLRKAI